MKSKVRVKILTLSAGPKGTRRPGDVLELDADEAKILIDGRYAQKTDDKTAAEMFADRQAAEAAAEKKAEKEDDGWDPNGRDPSEAAGDAAYKAAIQSGKPEAEARKIGEAAYLKASGKGQKEADAAYVEAIANGRTRDEAIVVAKGIFADYVAPATK